MTPGVTRACSDLTPAALSGLDRPGYLLSSFLFKARADRNKLIEHLISLVFDPGIYPETGTPDLLCGISDRVHQQIV